jgi:hypothetical protein
MPTGYEVSMYQNIALIAQSVRKIAVSLDRGAAADRDALADHLANQSWDNTDDLRSRYREHPDPDRLLPEPFTLLQLQRAHEAVAGVDLVKDTFRRNMQPNLIATGKLAEGTRGKPARLWRHTTKGEE